MYAYSHLSGLLHSSLITAEREMQCLAFVSSSCTAVRIHYWDAVILSSHRNTDYFRMVLSLRWLLVVDRMRHNTVVVRNRYKPSVLNCI